MIAEYEMKQHIDISKQEDVNQKYFWFLVNKIRKPKGNVQCEPIKFSDGNMTCEPTKLAEQWRQYFEKLSTPADQPEFDAKFKDIIEQKLTEMSLQTYTNNDRFLKDPLAPKELELAIRKLKKGKAAGHDMLVAEHIQYASKEVQNIILIIMQTMIDLEYIPVTFRYGICIPLHKGHDKVKSDPDNYRKITLLPVLCKLFETVLLNRSDKFIISDNKVGELQGAAQEGASCLHTSLLLKETIQNKVDEDGSVHVVFLDARKAFDCVWSDALFVRLYELGVNGKLWRILKEWYRDLQCFVRVGCVYSQTFRVRIGVFQGGKWSSRLFQVFYSELINMLCKTLIGCNIYNLRAVCPTYADDIAIVAPFRVTMQRLLQVVESFAS